MSRPTTTREALIVEALGDMAQLIDRIEALTPAMDQARQALAQASADLTNQSVAFERGVNAMVEGAKTVTVQHIVRRTNEISRQSQETQTRAMASAAQTLFRSEVHPALQRLAPPLQDLVDRLDRPWRQWWMHAATATTASVLTSLAILHWVH